MNGMSDTQRFLNVALEAVKKTEPVFLKSLGTQRVEVKTAKEGEVSEADKEIEHTHEAIPPFPTTLS